MWQYEGDFTLYDLMQKKEWPYNLEPLLFGRELDLPRGARRRWVTLRLVMKQVRARAACATCGARGAVLREHKTRHAGAKRGMRLTSTGARHGTRWGPHTVWTCMSETTRGGSAVQDGG